MDVHQIVSSCVSALSYMHKITNGPDPAASFLVEKLLQTVKKLQPIHGNRLAITEEILSLHCDYGQLLTPYVSLHVSSGISCLSANGQNYKLDA